MSNFAEVVIKDGNRIVNWEFAKSSMIEDILQKWEENYHPVNRKHIVINGRVLLPGCLLFRLDEFKNIGDKIMLRVESVKKAPEKEGQEND